MLSQSLPPLPDSPPHSSPASPTASPSSVGGPGVSRPTTADVSPRPAWERSRRSLRSGLPVLLAGFLLALLALVPPAEAARELTAGAGVPAGQSEAAAPSHPVASSGDAVLAVPVRAPADRPGAEGPRRPEDRSVEPALPRQDRPRRPGIGGDRELPVHAVHGLSHSARGHAAGHVVVRFAPGLARWQEDAVATGLGAPALARARFADFARAAVPAGASPEEMVERFRSHPSVAWAGTDPLIRAADVGFVAAGDGVSADDSITGAATNDPFYDAQWYLQRIHLEEALARNPQDGRGVVVAVIDSGVAYGNGAEFPRRQVPDLGGVTFLPGWDFVDNDPEPLDLGTASGNPTRNPRFGHGTFVTTIIAAQVGNGLAGAGVAPNVSILPVRVLGIDGFGTGSGIAEGIRFAVDAGADVINLSLGGTSSFQPGADAVRYALSRGVVVVAAAGNEADDEEVFADELGSDVAWPARYPGVIAVGATDFDGTRATYSNYGPNLDLMAPAGNDTNREVGGNSRDGVLSTGFLHLPATGETLYGGFIANGTSFAAPQVAGVAALLLSLGVEGPDAVAAILRLTTQELQGEGFDLQTGHGLLDAAAAHRGLGLTN